MTVFFDVGPRTLIKNSPAFQRRLLSSSSGRTVKEDGHLRPGYHTNPRTTSEIAQPRIPKGRKVLNFRKEKIIKFNSLEAPRLQIFITHSPRFHLHLFQERITREVNTRCLPITHSSYRNTTKPKST